MDLYGEFEWRGLIYDATDGLRELLARESVTAYSGFDPTAASLHVGHLLPALALARLQRLGHRPVAVVGGGTGLIGDPSGKSTERTLLSVEQVQSNVERIRMQLSQLLDFTPGPRSAALVNNAEWLTTMSAMEFLRDVGKHFSVNAMLAKESVKRRLASEDGISYTEFSYSLLQAYDFVQLFDRFGCTLQIGGSDQWGNIVSGCDLIRRIRAQRAHGLVMPLLTTASGTKFGKTEGGAVWLDPALTRPYEFYQFWLHADDRDAVKYLRFFTFLDQARIRELEESSARAPERRIAQRELAHEVTRLIHGEAAVREAEAASAKLFGGSVATMSVAELLEVFPNVPSASIEYASEGWPIIELLVSAGVASSKSEAARLIRGGGISVNDRRVTNEKERLMPEQAIEGQMLLIRKGKRDNYLLRIAKG
jgi:tyrosyl-tRNA synthetase